MNIQSIRKKIIASSQDVCHVIGGGRRGRTGVFAVAFSGGYPLSWKNVSSREGSFLDLVQHLVSFLMECNDSLMGLCFLQFALTQDYEDGDEWCVSNEIPRTYFDVQHLRNLVEEGSLFKKKTGSTILVSDGLCLLTSAELWFWLWLGCGFGLWIWLWLGCGFVLRSGCGFGFGRHVFLLRLSCGFDFGCDEVLSLVGLRFLASAELRF